MLEAYGSKSGITLVNRGVAHLQNGTPDAAMADFDAACTMKPRVAQAYFNRAQLHAAQGQEERAEADLALALALEPTNALSGLAHGALVGREGKRRLQAMHAFAQHLHV